MPIFLFHGPDTYSHGRKLTFWQKEFEKKHNGINITIILGKETSARDLLEVTCSMPFLSEKRLVIVKDMLQDAESEQLAILAEKLDTIPDFCILVFSESEEVDKRKTLYKKIAKLGTVEEFPQLAGSKLVAWIKKNVTKSGGEIEPNVAQLLADGIGPDLHRLENEIAKLCNYCMGRIITVADVELLVTTSFSTSIFRLTDAIGQRDNMQALKTLHALIDSGEDMHRILYMIMRQFRIIASIKDLAEQGMSRDEISRQLQQHPFVISNTITQTRNFSWKQLQDAYSQLIGLDTQLKNGGIKIVAGDMREFVLALDRLVLAMTG